MRFSFTLMFLFILSMSYAQEEELQDFIESLANTEQRNLVDLVELYHDYQNKPFNLNTNDKDLFYSFPFLSSYQVNKVLVYRNQMKGFVAVEELTVLSIFSDEEMTFLLPLFSVKPPKVQARYASYTMEQIVRLATILEKQTGYNDKLKGSKPNLYLRNKQKWDSQLQLGVTIQKDAGEYMFNSAYVHGVDFVSASLAYKPKAKHLKSVVLGDFSLNLGQGLVMWNGFSMGKGVSSVSSSKNSMSLMSYHGSDEVHFMRGAAARLVKGSFSLIPYISIKKIDALIKEDTTISSIRVDGYHRTVSEIVNKGTVDEMIYGSSLIFREDNKQIGLHLVSMNYSHALSYHSAYQQQYTTGKNELFSSLDHSFIGKNWQFYGELALDKKGDYSFLEGLNYYATPNLTFNSTIRKYTAGYRSFYANSFGERSNANNEIGIYTGIDLNLGKGYSLKSYLDLYAFPSLSYGEDTRVEGQDFFTEVRKKLSNKSSVYFRLKSETRKFNDNKGVSESISRFRVHYKTEIGDVTFQSRIETSLYSPYERGFLVFQDIKKRLRRVTVSTRLAYFDTPSYQSSVYAYQPNFLYAFRSKAYFHQGFQVLLMLKVHLTRKLKLSVKYQRVQYLNKETVGSGYYETEVPYLTEASFQLQFLI